MSILIYEIFTSNGKINGKKILTLLYISREHDYFDEYVELMQNICKFVYNTEKSPTTPLWDCAKNCIIKSHLFTLRIKLITCCTHAISIIYTCMCVLLVTLCSLQIPFLHGNSEDLTISCRHIRDNIPYTFPFIVEFFSIRKIWPFCWWQIFF